MESSLGLMKNSPQKILNLSQMAESARHEALSSNLLILTKSNTRSRVHRPAYIDYIGIKRFDKQGRVIGEDRFIGLYASSTYTASVMQLPLLGHKIERIMKASGYEAGSHAYKALLNILETYPRDELIQASESELLNIGMGVLEMQERDLTRLFVRRDIFGRFFSCMVYVTKDRYSTDLAGRIRTMLKNALHSEEEVEMHPYFSEGRLARAHYIVRVENNNMDVDVNDIQINLVEVARSWEDKLESALLSNYGEARGNKLARRYVNGFPRSYKEDVLPGVVVADIAKMESLSAEHTLDMMFYRPQEELSDSDHVHLKLFHKDRPIYLSDVMPMLENMGLRVIGERPYQIRTSDGEIFWILEFMMLYSGASEMDLEKSQGLFQDAFAMIWHGQLEDDGFNRLVLEAGLTGREVSVLRSYAKYMLQTGWTFSQAYTERTLIRYPKLAGLLLELFRRRFSPKLKQDGKLLDKLHNQIIDQLDNVANLDDDRIIRRYMEMIEATLRTNYYQADRLGRDKRYISFKISPRDISDMPLPLPNYEIFVYSPRVEGVHLRFGKIARGGLRWSDRREDFRTEVLGLAKAQQVKNTVIVPVGAKGGFVCKLLPEGDRQAIFEEGKNCYRTFIRGLLDITDNMIKGEVVAPENVVRHDDDDYYLVVAADKGTATFSDIANEISEEYGHWLGDAFASGGSVGYDHKKMGITALGAWESVKRHFREMDIDCQTTDFTCVGIGDMAGDVFGNGMLLSRHTRLVGAFNHQHIFIDPDPDAASSYIERQRLFEMAGSSWGDYNSELISEGGGIFPRSAKSIRLSPQMKKLFKTQRVSMPPNDVIRALLLLEVDLLWNGGIGTYVKSVTESDVDVGDRANDAVRVNGCELNVRIVGEGGNLGCTQLGRIEYASKGGRINTDFIDNVGGVDCSDNEVNIKILLNGLVARGDLTMKQRNRLLYEMTDEVANIVLTNAYRQSQSISISSFRAAELLKEQQRFIHTLEKENKLDRALEHLPTDEELTDRIANDRGLTRPELSVLVSYSKMVLKEELDCEEISSDPYLMRLLLTNFPPVLQDRFGDAMPDHPLASEIIATRLANMMVNDMGLNFSVRMKDETGAGTPEIAACFIIAREVFGMEQLWRDIEAMDNHITAEVQLEMLMEHRRLVRRVTRWFLRGRDRSLSIQQNIDFFRPALETLHENLYKLMEQEEVEQFSLKVERLIEKKVPKHIATQIVHMGALFSVLDVAQVAEKKKRDIRLVAEVYFRLGARMGLHWFMDQINDQPVANHWQALAKASFREELDWQQRSLTSAVLGSEACKDKEVCFSLLESWIELNDPLLQRWNHMLSDFKVTSTHEYAKFSVALRELNLLNLNCRNIA